MYLTDLQISLSKNIFSILRIWRSTRWTYSRPWCEVGEERCLALFVLCSALDLLLPPSFHFTTRVALIMAYNREWDRGKDNWDDSTWNDYQGKGNVRGREDDYYGEGKRRKFNNGVRNSAMALFSVSGFTMSFQGYDPSQGWDEGGYNNYNQGRANNAQWQQQEHADDRQHWNAHNKKRQVPSEPSPHVIFLGLDPDFTEADVCLHPFHISTILSLACC